MSCNLTRSRAEACKDSVAGIKEIFLVDYGNLGTYTLGSHDEITNCTSAADFSLFKYELKGNSNFEQTITANLENGTTFFEQSLNVTLKQLSKEDHKELKLLSYGRPHIAVEDYNGHVFLMGTEHGAELSGGTIATGASMGDLSGYSLTFTGMERRPANFVDAPTDGSPFAGMASASATITEGTN